MIYSVIVDISASEVDRIFDYKGEGYEVGQRVLVDFANRQKEGIIIGVKNKTTCPPNKLKQIIRSLDDFTAISPELLSLGEFMRQEYQTCALPIWSIICVTPTYCACLFLPKCAAIV